MTTEPQTPILGVGREEVILALYNLSNYYLEHAFHLYAAGIGVGIAECCTTQVGGQRAVMLVEMMRLDCEEDLSPKNKAAKGTLMTILAGLALEFSPEQVQSQATAELKRVFPEVIRGINHRVALSEYGGLANTDTSVEN